MPAPKRSSSSSKKSPVAAKRAGTTAKRTSTTAKRATDTDGASVAEQLARGDIKPRDLVVLTRERIQEALDEAAARGRVTRKDANDLVAELVRRGRQHGGGLRDEIDDLLERGRDQLDRARRKVGVGRSFPILGYDDLTAVQVKSRLGDLSKPELRQVLTYERAHANRKSVTGPLEKAIG